MFHTMHFGHGSGPGLIVALILVVVLFAIAVRQS